MLISQPFNIQENAIRPFIIDRENWLFTASESSAHASAAIYGLIETCRANERVPYHYLRHFQKSCIDQVPLKTMKTCRPEILMEGLQWFPDWLTRVWFINRLPSTSLKILNIQNMPSLFSVAPLGTNHT